MARCEEIYQDVINEMATYYDWSEEYQEQMIEETETEIKQHINFT